MLRPFLAMSALLWSAWSIPDFAAVLAAGLGVMPLAFFWAGCPCCTTGECCSGADCSCNSGTLPSQYEVVIAGFSGTCYGGAHNCSDLNATYILDPTGVTCEYSTSVTSLCDPGVWPYLTIVLAITCYNSVSPAKVSISVSFGSYGTPGTILHTYRDRVTYTAPIDCTTGISSVSLPWLLDGFGDCPGSSTTCTVTAL